MLKLIFDKFLVSDYRLNLPGQETSRRSSLSEASGLSSASTRTYINEASTLVLETIENGIKKHYLVPLSLAQKSRWKKKGAKLHIFNDHTFVAKHLPGWVIRLYTRLVLVVVHAKISKITLFDTFFQWYNMSSVRQKYSEAIRQTRIRVSRLLPKMP